MNTYASAFIAIIFLIQTAIKNTAFAQEAGPAQQQNQLASEAQRFADLINANKPAEAGSLLQESQTPYSLLLATTCQGQENFLNGFVNEVSQTNGNGYVVEGQKVKGSLTKNENVNGDRNFDYDKILNAMFATETSAETKRCLHYFNLAALSEYAKYFASVNQEFGCGLYLNLEAKPPKVDTVSSEKTKKCSDTDYGGEPLPQFLEKGMAALGGVIDKWNRMNAEANRVVASETSNAGKTEAGVSKCTGNDCSQHQGLDYPDTVKVINKKCCDIIRDKWAELGFSTIKDAKPSNKICNDMTDNENDEGYCEGRACVSDLGKCLMNFFGAFAKNAYSSFVESFDALGWVSQLGTLWDELKKDPFAAAQKIGKNMLGYDGEHMKCLNKKSQTQYYCQMLGKFSGSSAGFSAGMGGIVGGALGLTKGVKALAKARSAKEIRNVSLIKEPIKQAVKTGAKAAAVSTIWPYFVARGTLAVGVKSVKAAWTYPPYYFNRVTGGDLRSKVADSASRVQSAIAGRAATAAPDGAASAATPGAPSGAAPGAAPNISEELLKSSRVVEKPNPIRTGTSGKLLNDAESVLKQKTADFEKIRAQQDSILSSRGAAKTKKAKVEWESSLRQNQESMLKARDEMKEAAQKVEKLKAEVQGKKVNNRIGVGAGIGTGAQTLPKSTEEKKEPTKEKDDGRTVAPPTEGLGPGIRPTNSQGQGAAAAPAPAPAAAPAVNGPPQASPPNDGQSADPL